MKVLKKLVINMFVNAIGIVLLIMVIIKPRFILSALAFVLVLISIIGWVFIFLSHINNRRRSIFIEKINKLDRNNAKYHYLFIIFDYLNGKDEDIDVLRSALQNVYFFPSRVIRNPQKVKNKEMFWILVEYYLSLTNDKAKNGFLWDYNINFFTWRFILFSSLISVIGITTLVLCYEFIPQPNNFLYTSLYFFFGIFIIPLLAKFFGYII